MPKPPRLPNGPRRNPGQLSGARPTYTVGYRRPPVHSRFKAGQSGNPKGRPKRHRNVRTIVEETLSERVKLKVGDQIRFVTKLEAVVQTIVNGALQRDPKAQASLMALVRFVGMLDEAPEASNSEPFTVNDEAVVADFLQRFNAAPAPPGGLEDNGDPTAGTAPSGKRAAP